MVSIAVSCIYVVSSVEFSGLHFLVQMQCSVWSGEHYDVWLTVVSLIRADMRWLLDFWQALDGAEHLQLNTFGVCFIMNLPRSFFQSTKALSLRSLTIRSSENKGSWLLASPMERVMWRFPSTSEYFPVSDVSQSLERWAQGTGGSWCVCDWAGNNHVL